MLGTDSLQVIGCAEALITEDTEITEARFPNLARKVPKIGLRGLRVSVLKSGVP